MQLPETTMPGRRQAPNHRAFPKPNHNHRTCSTNALEAAERICDAKQVRLTNIRKKVLEVIWSSHRPIGAYDLLKQLATDAEPLAPTTVYRALDFLMEQGLVHRLATLNAFVGCAHPDSRHVPHFMICDACGTAAEFDQQSADKLLAKTATENGFFVKSKVIELTGTCLHCVQI